MTTATRSGGPGTATVAYKITIPTSDGKSAHGKTRHPEIEFIDGVAYTTSADAAAYAQDVGWNVETVEPSDIPATHSEETAERERQERDRAEVLRDRARLEMGEPIFEPDPIDEVEEADTQVDPPAPDAVDEIPEEEESDDRHAEAPPVAAGRSGAAEATHRTDEPVAANDGDAAPQRLELPKPAGAPSATFDLETARSAAIATLALAAGYTDGQWAAIETRFDLTNAHGNRLNALRRKLIGLIEAGRSGA